MTEKTEDFLEVDDPVRGQEFACLSFISPEKVIREKNLQYLHKFLKTIAPTYDLDKDSIIEKFKDFLYVNEENFEKEYNLENDFQTSVRGVKVRGVYSNIKEAQNRAKKLQKIDPNFNVYIGQVGYWLPWDPRADKVEDQEYAEPKLNELVKKYKENESNKDQHFRENIDYVREQNNKTKLENLEDQVTELISSSIATGLDSTDPWLARKLEETASETPDAETQVNTAN